MNWSFSIQYELASIANIVATIVTDNSNCYDKKWNYGINFLI